MNRKPAAFHSCVLFGFLSPSDGVDGEPSLGLDLTVCRENLPATEISFQNFEVPWEPSHPSHASSPLPASLGMVKWLLPCVCDSKAFLQLVFSWLFWMISLQFSRNSRLVLGGG